MNPRQTFAAAGALLMLGCSLEVGVGETTPQSDEVEILEFEAAGDRRITCEAGDWPGDPAARSRAPGEIRQILGRDGETLVATDSGLYRVREGRRHRILPPAMDHFLDGDTLYRLVIPEGRVERLRLAPDAAPVVLDSMDVETHDRSVAVVSGDLLLHSSLDRSNHLLTRRSAPSGRVTGRALPIERDFERLFFEDFERLLRPRATLRAADAWLAFIPLLEGPVRLLNLEEGTAWTLRSDVEEPGEIELIASEREVRECDSCPGGRMEHHRERRRYRNVHAGGAFSDTAFWLLSHATPGSVEATIHRFPLPGTGADGEARSWRLDGLNAPPRDLAVRGDTLLIASRDHLYRWDGRLAAASTCRGS